MINKFSKLLVNYLLSIVVALIGIVISVPIYYTECKYVFESSVNVNQYLISGLIFSPIIGLIILIITKMLVKLLEP